jgi:TolB-like protein/tetratricopeptide (TPR) repeat protein
VDRRSVRGSLRFGPFELDQSAGELRKDGIRIRLQEQPLELLQILLEQPGNVIAREELQRRIWPSDTFVDFDHGINNAVKRLREALGDTAETPHYIETLPRRGYRFIGDIEVPTKVPPGRIQSLAVLPLEDLSHDPEQEYFAEGLTEALITALAKIGELCVTSRTSVMLYERARKPLPEIARELRVDGIVEGTVLRSGGRVRISAQLIDGKSDQHLWAESYDRDLQDVLALHSDVAQAIAREVQIKLTPQEQAQFARTRSVDPEAYEAYLKGRYYWNRRTPIGVKKGIECFQQAIEKDGAYAAAYAGLADCAGAVGFWGFASPTEGCKKAKTAARKSLEIEETAEAHASLGYAILHYDWDFSAAESEFQRAIKLNPRYPSAHQWYAHCLAYTGRLDRALQEANRAVQLDPLSLIIRTTHAGVFWLSRRWDQAKECCHKALELDSSFAALRWMLAHVYQAKGTYDDAIRERQHAMELSGGAPVFLAELGESYAVAGKKQEALQILEQLGKLSGSSYVMPYWLALIHAGLKQNDAAFACLEAAYRERSATLALLRMDPRLDCLRDDPRFQDLVRRINFPT